jgi:hypothetical protein
MDKNGVIVLKTPNPQSIKNTLNLFLKGSLYAFQPKHLKEHHFFTNWEYIVKFYLENLGFKVVEYEILDTHYKNYKPKNVKEFIKKRMECYIEKRNEKAQGMSYGLVAINK